MKKEILKNRGIRFCQDVWDDVIKKAKTEKLRPSDVVRIAVKKYLYNEKDVGKK